MILCWEELLSISTRDISIDFLFSMVILVMFINCFLLNFLWVPTSSQHCRAKSIVSARHASSISRLLSCVWMVLFFLKQTVCNLCVLVMSNPKAI